MFKTLTLNNWMTFDPAALCFALPTSTGAQEVNAEDWTHFFLAVSFSRALPQDVLSLYQAARATMLYGTLFYPLFTTGLELLGRADEAALRHFALGRVSCDFRTSYATLVDKLKVTGHLTDGQAVWWHSARQSRNRSAHAQRQEVVPPS